MKQVPKEYHHKRAVSFINAANCIANDKLGVD